jgi:hypothetical protein
MLNIPESFTAVLLPLADAVVLAIISISILIDFIDSRKVEDPY